MVKMPHRDDKLWFLYSETERNKGNLGWEQRQRLLYCDNVAALVPEIIVQIEFISRFDNALVTDTLTSVMIFNVYISFFCMEFSNIKSLMYILYVN